MCNFGMWSIPLRAIAPYNSVLLSMCSNQCFCCLLVLAYWDTRQISRVTPSFTLEEPLGLLMMRLKSNFFTKLWKHLTGLWEAILILSTGEESSMALKSWKALDVSMFQVFHILRGFLNIFKKKMFANK